MGYVILILVMLLSLGTGGWFIWHGIGASAVAKHQLEEQQAAEKLAIVAKTKDEEAEKWLANAAAQHEVDEANQKVVEKIIYKKGEDVVRYLPAAARSIDCTIPPSGMALLNGARGDLQNTTAADILGLTQPANDAVMIRDTDPRVPPEQATKPQPVTPVVPPPSRPSKPIPVPK